ncbi:hypothetical protein NPIL_562221 [Nephila pilipes]|uniref:Reverse transcriptase RNase H-like domain-containing protein n=1 Tax=Nephila pilipes TaxID=299642 RepID=A0A8X6TCS0_NEPPI|nr:hypothetical protein NPIL_562221 [Nephila pilipes]
MEPKNILLSSEEQNYSTTKREALAVIWAPQKFHGHSEGAEVIISFFRNAQNPWNKRSGSLSPQELQHGKRTIIQAAQIR